MTQSLKLRTPLSDSGLIEERYLQQSWINLFKVALLTPEEYSSWSEKLSLWYAQRRGTRVL
jgi:hypothetical protein